MDEYRLKHNKCSLTYFNLDYLEIQLVNTEPLW